MKILRYNQANFDRQIAKKFSRRAVPSQAVRDLVADVIAQVERSGDRAVLSLTKKFDKASLTTKSMFVPKESLKAAAKTVSKETKAAVAASRENVTAFAKKSLRADWKMKNAQGAEVGEMFQPFQRVGVYVPGGSAPLVSTTLMTVAIAKAAGVPEIVVCTPPGPDGEVNTELLYALGVAGATEVYKIGGAQAVAAMAIGTKTMAPVDKVFGPGNPFVVEAKRQLFGRVAVDLLPGPSEVLVLADSSARADFIAADLLAQAEHGGDSDVVFVTDSAKLLDAVVGEVKEQAKSLTRQDQVKKVLRNGTTLVLAKSIAQGVSLCNDYAPEHLSLIVRNEDKVIPKIVSTGAIYVGRYSAVAVGDFLAGPSHTLPTGGSGKSFPGITAEMFQRRTSVVRISKAAMKRSAPVVETFAEIEGLDAHGRSATIRVE
jgi:histidinol dehydrogenase